MGESPQPTFQSEPVEGEDERRARDEEDTARKLAIAVAVVMILVVLLWPTREHVWGFLLYYSGAISALGGMAVAGFTLMLWISTDKLWKASATQLRQAQTQLDLAREEFVATHRPRLIVRGIGFAQGAAGEKSEPESVEFVIANVGETDATILELHAAVWVLANDAQQPPEPPYDETPIAELANIVIRDGARHVGRYAPGIRLGNLITILQALEFGPTKRIRFVGRLLYADAVVGPERGEYSMAFCRSYDFDLGRFVRERPPEPDYEYGEGDAA